MKKILKKIIGVIILSPFVYGIICVIARDMEVNFLVATGLLFVIILAVVLFFAGVALVFFD